MKIPRTLGRYEVLDLIGRGGMGVLYRARDPRIGRFVAIKQLRPEFDTPEVRDRFSREAAAAGSLSHPNIVTIYDVGEDEGLPFIAMEYVRGETFTDLLGLRPPLSVPRKLQLIQEVCAGLAHAHEAGIVHRDIKPANLIVGSEGIVKILDFGIAKLSSSTMTLPGSVLGTMNYMAPEQIRGLAVDARADIFAVGAVLYELLTHRQAFPGRAANEVLQRILKGVPEPIANSCPDIDPRLTDLVSFALEKDRDRRIQEIATLQKELENLRSRPSIEEPRHSVSRRTGSSHQQTGLVTPLPAPVPGRRSVTNPGREVESGRRQIDHHLAAAEREFAAGNYDAAIESCKRVLMLDDSDERAISQLDRIHAAIDEQQALADLAAANAQAEARRRAGVADARRRFAAGEHHAAISMLEALDPASDALVAEALEELRSTLREIEEAQRVREELAERRRRLLEMVGTAREAIQRERFDEAVGLLEALREIDSDAPEVTDLAERLRRAQAAARLKADLDVIFRDFEDALGLNDFQGAGDRLSAAARLAPNESRIPGAQARLDHAKAAQAARDAAEARALQVAQRLEEASAHLDAGDLDGAADLLKLATDLAPHDARVGEFSLRLREATERRAAAEAAARLAQQIADLIASAARRLESAGDQTSELLAARQDVDQALALGPGNTDAVSLKAAIEEAIAAHREAARMNAAISNARARFANGKRLAAIRLLEEYQPPHPDIAAALNDLRAALQKIEEEQRAEQERIARQERVAALLTDAQTAIQDKRFDAALEHLQSLEEIDPASPALVELRERVHQEQAAFALEAELAATLARFDEHVTAGDLSAAADVLGAAEALAPTDHRVEMARQRLEQVVAARQAAEARARDLEAKHTEAVASFERGDFQESRRLLQLAQDLDVEHARTAGLAALSERVESAIAQLEAAEAARQRRQAADDLVAAAGARLESAESQGGDLELAVREIDQALALEPDHAGALAVKVTLDAAVAASQKAAFIRASIRNARNRFANGKYQAAIRLLESLDPSSDPSVEQTLQELRQTLHDIEERRRVEEELAAKRRQIASLIGAARAAINAGQFEDALGALAAVRAIDASADGLAQLTERAERGQAGRAGAVPRSRETDAAADKDATRFMQIDPELRASLRNPKRSAAPALPSVDQSDEAEDRTWTGIRPAEPEQRRGATGSVWLWVVAAAVLLLIVLGTLYRYNRSSRTGAYPVERAGSGVLARSADPRATAHRCA